MTYRNDPMKYVDREKKKKNSQTLEKSIEFIPWHRARVQDQETIPGNLLIAAYLGVAFIANIMEESYTLIC